jgi:hypothetical protein
MSALSLEGVAVNAPISPLARRPSLLLGSVLVALALGAPAPAQQTSGDPKAQEVAHRLLDTLGGREAWEETRFLDFHFFGRRHHVWDKHTGRHRVEGETREGQRYVVLHNVHDQGKGAGRVFLDGQEADGEQRAQFLENAYGAWINDTYWLLAPYKLLDAGVTLAYEGEETVDDAIYDKLRLSFSVVGLTPGDRYGVYVDRGTGLVSRWSYILENQDPAGPATAWHWLDWKTYGKIRLATTRKEVGGQGRELSLAPIAVPESVPDAVFTEP